MNAEGVDVALHLRRRLFALELRARALADALERRAQEHANEVGSGAILRSAPLDRLQVDHELARLHERVAPRLDPGAVRASRLASSSSSRFFSTSASTCAGSAVLALEQLDQREVVSGLEDARRARAGREHERGGQQLGRGAEARHEAIAPREPSAAAHVDLALARGVFERLPAAHRLGELLRAPARALAQRLAAQQVVGDLLAHRLERARERLLAFLELDQMEAEVASAPGRSSARA